MGALKPGKQLITNVGAVSISTLMPGTCIIYMNIIRDFESGGKNSIFFSMKDIFVFVNNSIELTGRDVDAELQELSKNQRLRDIGVIILVQDIPD